MSRTISVTFSLIRLVFCFQFNCGYEKKYNLLLVYFAVLLKKKTFKNDVEAYKNICSVMRPTIWGHKKLKWIMFYIQHELRIDLSPSDYHLIRTLENSMNPNQFHNKQDIKSHLNVFNYNKTLAFYSHGIIQLMKRLE